MLLPSESRFLKLDIQETPLEMGNFIYCVKFLAISILYLFCWQETELSQFSGNSFQHKSLNSRFHTLSCLGIIEVGSATMENNMEVPAPNKWNYGII